MLAADGFFSQNGIGNFGFRWLHILAGITWIGLLYYFNFVQVPAFAQYEQHEGGARARNITVDKLATKALWYFRWAAISTFVTGILITLITKDYFSNGFGKSSGGIAISTGMLLGTIMMLNVWGVIWRNQKVVIANARNVQAGGEADPAAAECGRKALLASRQNTIFSLPMLVFMVGTSHFPYDAFKPLSGGTRGTYWAITIVVWLLFELNALGVIGGFKPGGINAMYDTHRNTLITGFVYALFVVVIYALVLG